MEKLFEEIYQKSNTQLNEDEKSKIEESVETLSESKEDTNNRLFEEIYDSSTESD